MRRVVNRKEAGVGLLIPAPYCAQQNSNPFGEKVYFRTLTVPNPKLGEFWEKKIILLLELGLLRAAKGRMCEGCTVSFPHLQVLGTKQM